MDDRTNGAPPPGATPDPQPPDPGRPQPRTRAEERIAGLDTSTTSLTQRIEELERQLEEAQREATESRAGWQRSAADFTNYRRRTEQERADAAGLANDALLLKVVMVADDFDRAIEHIPAEAKGSPWVEGVVAIDRKLRQLLESEGVAPMETLGQPFDPYRHQAIAHEDTREAPDGTVLRELQRGYTVRERVLRPALVAVARNEPTSSHDDGPGIPAPDTRE